MRSLFVKYVPAPDKMKLNEKGGLNARHTIELPNKRVIMGYFSS